MTDAEQQHREGMIRLLAAVTFLIFFQAYMVAPLLPRLAVVFQAPIERVGLIVPAYLIPYGAATLVYGVFSDRIGRRRILLASLAAFVLLTGLTATAQSIAQLLVWRLLTGIGASAVVPLSLALMGSLFPYEQRGRPLGWLFGAMAGGMAFGSTFGAVLEPVIGWRGLFLSAAILGLMLFGLVLRVRHLLGEPSAGPRPSLPDVLRRFWTLLSSPRGGRTYAFVLLNAMFHGGTFAWLGVYFARRFGLGEVGIGLALLGYGVPGFVLGPAIGRAADRWGRRRLLPLGLAVASVGAALLALEVPLPLAAGAVTILSLGYDMTQPLLAGIVTSLDPQRAGQAMGLNVFALFTGFGLGSVIFGAMLPIGFAAALAAFAAVQMAAALVALRLFSVERAERDGAERGEKGMGHRAVR
jgi:predicted MFS family arabinose efflux permease